MSGHILLGRAGEKAVREYLEKAGYCILETNYRNRYGEIDIIAENEDILVFVEVKTRSAKNCGIPEEAVDFRKQERIRKLALDYLCGKRSKFYGEIRFDVAAVSAGKDGLIRDIRVYEGAF